MGKQFKLIETIKRFEGFECTMYFDAAGLRTIGVGHLLTKDELSSGKINIQGNPIRYLGHGLTDDQVDALLTQDLEKFIKTIDEAVKVDLNNNQRIALISLAFNIGLEAFMSSTLRRKLNRGDYASVPYELNRWVWSGGKVLNGLEIRRSREGEIWNS